MATPGPHPNGHNLQERSSCWPLQVDPKVPVPNDCPSHDPDTYQVLLLILDIPTPMGIWFYNCCLRTISKGLYRLISKLYNNLEFHNRRIFPVKKKRVHKERLSKKNRRIKVGEERETKIIKISFQQQNENYFEFNNL